MPERDKQTPENRASAVSGTSEKPMKKQQHRKKSPPQKGAELFNKQESQKMDRSPQSPAASPAGQQPSAQKRGRGRPRKQPVQEMSYAERMEKREAMRRELRETAPPQEKRRRGRPRKEQQQQKGLVHPVRMIPLGGLNEIGKNLYLYETEDDIIIVDCGLAFPDEDMFGVDLVIPDFTYIQNNLDRVRAVILTHGHEDHIGGLPFLLKLANLPVYGTKLTLALVEAKLREYGIKEKSRMQVVKAGDVLDFGSLKVELITVNHSIPDAVALAIFTPAGVMVHTGDFKIDYTPIEGNIIDLARFGELGRKGVLALMSDSTNAERPGSTPSERIVGESFMSLFKQAERRRIIIASFSSNIHRIQQIIDVAVAHGRKVALSGRSMLNVVAIAREVGYLQVPEGVMIDIEEIRRYPLEKQMIITTGSQGEPMSALTRMAMGAHRQVEVGQNDFIIISATPIPGNEKFIGRVINELMRLGANVVYERMYDVHVSGHAYQDELKLMLALTKPRYFVPMHGEQKHLKKHAGLAQSMGIDPRRILIGEIGRVIEADGVEMRFGGTVPAGRVLVDGLGVGDVGSVVLRDRKHLSEDGLIVVAAALRAETGELVSGPDIHSRGFVYVKEAEELMQGAEAVVRGVLTNPEIKRSHDFSNHKNRVRDALSDYVYQKTKRKPIILPVILEV